MFPSWKRWYAAPPAASARYPGSTWLFALAAPKCRVTPHWRAIIAPTTRMTGHSWSRISVAWSAKGSSGLTGKVKPAQAGPARRGGATIRVGGGEGG